METIRGTKSFLNDCGTLLTIRWLILFWTGFVFGRRTPLVPIQGNMTAVVYENNILQPIVNGIVETIGEEFTLQDHNARPHHPHSVQRFLVGHWIRRMDRPVCSPDRNCIENAWSFLKIEISNRHHPPLKIQVSGILLRRNGTNFL